MKKLIEDIRKLIVLPEYEKAFILWLEEVSNDPEFLSSSVVLESEPVLEKMLEGLGKSIFKKESPLMERLMLQKYIPDGLIHGFVMLEKKLVVILYFPDMGMGVSTVHMEPKQVIYTRLTRLEDTLKGNFFINNPDSSIN